MKAARIFDAGGFFVSSARPQRTHPSTWPVAPNNGCINQYCSS